MSAAFNKWWCDQQIKSDLPLVTDMLKEVAEKAWVAGLANGYPEMAKRCIEIQVERTVLFLAMTRIRDCGDSTEHRIARTAIKELQIP